MDFDPKSYYPGMRFTQADPNRAVQSPYDIPTDQLTDFIRRAPTTIQTIVLDLSTASNARDPVTGVLPVNVPTQGNWIEINAPGTGVVIYGFQADDPASPGTVLNQPVVSSVFVECAIQYNRPSNDDRGYPLKHNRGVRGPYEKVWVRWPAQTTTARTRANLVLLKYMYEPWMGGEAAT